MVNLGDAGYRDNVPLGSCSS